MSLEPEFWEAFAALAKRRGLSKNALAAEIDAARAGSGLASAIRLAVLDAARAGMLTDGQGAAAD